MEGAAQYLLIFALVLSANVVSTLPSQRINSQEEHPGIKLQISLKDLLPPFLQKLLKANEQESLVNSRIEGSISADQFTLKTQQREDNSNSQSNNTSRQIKWEGHATLPPQTGFLPISEQLPIVEFKPQTASGGSHLPPTPVVHVQEFKPPKADRPHLLHAGNIPIFGPTRATVTKKSISKREQLLEKLKRILKDL